MKTQNTHILTKKTVFVYKNLKGENTYRTDPTAATAHTVLTNIGDVLSLSFNK